MNEFPSKYMDVVGESSQTATPLLNVTEYLEGLFGIGIRKDDLPELQPIFQKRIWDRMEPGQGPDVLAQVIDELRKEDSRFHVEGGSWTNNISWVQGYDALLGPMERVSSLFLPESAQARISDNRCLVSPADLADQLLSVLGARALGSLWARALPKSQ